MAATAGAGEVRERREDVLPPHGLQPLGGLPGGLQRNQGPYRARVHRARHDPGLARSQQCSLGLGNSLVITTQPLAFPLN